MTDLKLIVGRKYNYIHIPLKSEVNDSMLRSVVDLLRTISDVSVDGEIIETREIEN